MISRYIANTHNAVARQLTGGGQLTKPFCSLEENNKMQTKCRQQILAAGKYDHIVYATR